MSISSSELDLEINYLDIGIRIIYININIKVNVQPLRTFDIDNQRRSTFKALTYFKCDIKIHYIKSSGIWILRIPKEINCIPLGLRALMEEFKIEKKSMEFSIIGPEKC